MRRGALYLGACLPAGLLLAGACWPVVLVLSLLLVALIGRKG